MLNRLKFLGRRSNSPSQIEELQRLMAAARAERDALESAVAHLSLRRTEISDVEASIARVDRQALESVARIEGLTARLDAMDERTAALAAIDARMQSLAAAAAQAERLLETLASPGGTIETHRQQVEQLSAQVMAAQAEITALDRERLAAADLRAELRRTSTDITDSLAASAQLQVELAQVRTLAGDLTRDYSALAATSRDARADAAAAVGAVRDVETKLEPLMQVQDLSRTTEQKLALLNGMLEHVTQKTRALDAQKQTLDRAVLDASRLNEMVWGMNEKIERLREHLKEADRAEATIGRIERLAEESDQRFDLAQKIRHEFARDVARFERDGRALVDVMRGMIDALALEQHRFQTFNERVTILQTTLEHAETRTGALHAQQEHLASLGRQMSALAGGVEALTTKADALGAKQAALDALHDRLSQIDDLARQTALRYDGLHQSRAELDSLRRDLQDLHRVHADASHLRDRLAADRAALEAFGDRMVAMRTTAPELETRIDAVLAKMSSVDEATAQAVRLGEMAVFLDAQLARLAARETVVEAVETRVNTLHAVAADVDRRMADQLARRAETDALRTDLDGTAAQVLDIHQKVEGIARLQERVAPLESRLRAFAGELDQLTRSVAAIGREEAETADRRARLEALLEDTRSLESAIAERILQVRGLTDALGRATEVKDELAAELALIESRQRDARAEADRTADQIQRIEALHAALDERGRQLRLSEHAMEGIGARLDALAGESARLDEAMQTLARYDALVLAVREQVAGVHRLGVEARADLDFVRDQRDEVAAMRHQLDTLLATAADTEEKIAATEERRATVEAVHTKANLVANLLEDVRVNLEALGQQKAVVDHVAARIARLEFVMQEAQNTVRALQQERELAERIEQNIAQLRSRTALPPDKGVPAV